MTRYTEDDRRMNPRRNPQRPAVRRSEATHASAPRRTHPDDPRHRPSQRPAADRSPKRAPVRRRRRRSRMPSVLAVLVLAALVAAILLLRPNAPEQPKQAYDPYPLKYTAEISAAAQEFGVPPAYLYAVILAESSFRPDATSSVGAMGLMQIMPDTGKWIAKKLGMRDAFTPEMLYEPAVSARYGAWYLRFLLDRYDGDMRCATAAYHAGQGKVDQWLDDPQYSPDGRTLAVIAYDSTNNYVNKVMKNYEQYLSLLSAAE